MLCNSENALGCYFVHLWLALKAEWKLSEWWIFPAIYVFKGDSKCQEKSRDRDSDSPGNCIEGSFCLISIWRLSKTLVHFSKTPFFFCQRLWLSNWVPIKLFSSSRCQIVKIVFPSQVFYEKIIMSEELRFCWWITYYFTELHQIWISKFRLSFNYSWLLFFKWVA